ncbi:MULTISPECIES: vanadium-dependent haloperoxidase [Niastella]|uniref:Vanadium-dependent haloperoxidase n=1 Tax=Niastella soli TaxID=2821487 RepID=A0ABS3YZZ8_9BACT|nr:vanadium-dependent haloperoxidase [Niastella soli]MBO9203496.1 vanadium-dependent haloperoxidase [Niastella soli]
MYLPKTQRKSSAKLLQAVLLLSLFYGCHKPDLPVLPRDESATVVYDWYKFIAMVQRPANPQPVVIQNIRNFGFIGVGLYEAVRPGSIGAESLSSRLYQMPAMPQADTWNQQYLWSESANAALASMFKSFLVLTDANKASIDSMENANYNRFSASTPDEVLMRSQGFGREIAAAIYNWSLSDGFNLSSVGYVPPPVTPGSWVPTPPAYANPVGPFLSDSRPFLEYSLTAMAPPLPFPFSEDTSSLFYKANKEVYDIGQRLTDEQKATANWWADAGGAGVGVPSPHHALSIITWVQENQQANLWKAAEVYAKTGIAFKDGPINTFRSKYHYNLIRPVTYVRRLIDTAWLSYLPTPPYPEYTSGLVGFYAPYIQVLIRSYGDIPVTDNAYEWRGLPARQFTSLSALLDEAALSRIYGGLHYRFTQEISIRFGKVLGNEIAAIRLAVPDYTHP